MVLPVPGESIRTTGAYLLHSVSLGVGGMSGMGSYQRTLCQRSHGEGECGEDAGGLHFVRISCFSRIDLVQVMPMFVLVPSLSRAQERRIYNSTQPAHNEQCQHVSFSLHPSSSIPSATSLKHKTNA